ncbi:amidohydrolase family protein [Actinacidiphila sp. ITFR-21]|uniref:amidohydrolase family protein n=1 Tax=Actinacidiphila sp. ITFR-21 TaxID=3075199 RepID=UPI00288964EC|nr:amidohydrolase family protein [Streptomyces sp. ITFR-21]WNI18790.1 amidohydrolase family protein [Streptomyces sp. ITFR-21]
MIVDAQLHLWGADSAGRPWPPGTSALAHRAEPYGAEELLVAMDDAGVERAVLVPPSWEGDRNDLALGAARRYPDRFSVMGRLSLADPPAALAWLAEQSADRGPAGRSGLLGLRFTFHRPPLSDQLKAGRLDWLWPALARAGLPVALYPPGGLRALGAVAERHPDLRLAVDHLALPVNVTGPAAFAELDDLLALADLPNVAVKATCLPAASARPYPFADLTAAVHRVFDAFGPDRMFWGSDLTRLPCTYRECVEHFTHSLPFLTGRDRERVMGGALLDWAGWPA